MQRVITIQVVTREKPNPPSFNWFVKCVSSGSPWNLCNPKRLTGLRLPFASKDLHRLFRIMPPARAGARSVGVQPRRGDCAWLC